MSSQPENPSKEQIERRAHEIYLQRGGADGGDVADWLQADEELKVSARKSAGERAGQLQRAAKAAGAR